MYTITEEDLAKVVTQKAEEMPPADSEVVPGEKPAKEEKAAETQEPEPAEKKEEEEKPAETPTPESETQKEINTRIREKHDLIRLIQSKGGEASIPPIPVEPGKKKSRIAQLDAQISALKEQAAAIAAPKPTQPVTADATEFTKPFPKYADFLEKDDPDEAFERAKVEWAREYDRFERDKEEKANRQNQEVSERQSFVEKQINSAYQKFGKEFDAVAGSPEVQKILSINPALRDAVIDSEFFPEIAMELGANLEAADHLAGLSGRALDRAIGLMEAKILAKQQDSQDQEGSEDNSTVKPTAPFVDIPVTKAPQISSGVRPTGSTVGKDPNKMSMGDLKDLLTKNRKY